MMSGLNASDPWQLAPQCLTPDQRVTVWTKDITVNHHCHHMEGSPNDHLETFGLMGLAMAFSVPIIAHSQLQSLLQGESINSELDQMEEIKQKAQITVTVFDGTV